jgi:hypothetical protein
MLKKVTSIQDIQQDDVIFDDPDAAKAKQYKIENINNGNVYAIHADGTLDLRIINSYDLSAGNWWKKDE